MKVIYSNHLINRLHLRNIPEHLPAEIVDTSQERYYDIETGYHIAVKKAFLHGGMRELMVAYAIEGEVRRLITIHPLKEGQKSNRLRNGRWVRSNERV